MLKRNQNFSCFASSSPTKRLENAFMLELNEAIQPARICGNVCIHSLGVKKVSKGCWRNTLLKKTWNYTNLCNWKS